MTDKEKTLLGIYPLKFSSSKHLHFVPQLGEVNIFPHHTVQDVLELIYWAGVESGKKMGRTTLANEFKSLLNINTRDE